MILRRLLIPLTVALSVTALGASEDDLARALSRLSRVAELYRDNALADHFNEVLAHERDFWKMAWEG